VRTRDPRTSCQWLNDRKPILVAMGRSSVLDGGGSGWMRLHGSERRPPARLFPRVGRCGRDRRLAQLVLL
jgi:hypothetical protein